MSETPAPRRVPLIIPAVLISASAASILSTDLYTPSLPHLPAYFDTDAESVQLTLSLNLLGFAAAQLVYGPLSDRFGRRPVARFLPETTVPDRAAMGPRRLLNDYGTLFRTRRYLVTALVLGATLGALFAFITAAPFILIDRLGVRTQDFGYYQAVIVVAFFVGSFGANRGVARLGVDRMVRMGLGLAVLGALGFPLVLLAGLETATAITATMSVYALGLGFTFAAGPVVALAAAPGGRGVAAAMLGALEMGGAALGALAVTALHDGSSWPPALVVAGFSLIALLVSGLGGDRRSDRRENGGSRGGTAAFRKARIGGLRRLPPPHHALVGEARERVAMALVKRRAPNAPAQADLTLTVHWSDKAMAPFRAEATLGGFGAPYE